MPAVTRFHAFAWALGRAFGIVVESTRNADAANPIEVPTNSQLNDINVRASAASTGLSRLSMV
jgi:hypothetical protein